MAPAPRRAGAGPGRPGHDTESVLAGAVEVFITRGYDGTSMEDLARHLGITKSAIYHHVPGKEALLSMALDRAHAGLFAVAEEVRRMEAPAAERLRRLVHDSVVVLVEQLPYVTLLLRVRGNTPVERQALGRRRAFDALAAGLVAEAVAEGDLRADIEPHLAARLLFGLVNSLVEWYRPRAGGDAAGLADAVTAVAFDGLRAPGGQPSR